MEFGVDQARRAGNTGQRFAVGVLDPAVIADRDDVKQVYAACRAFSRAQALEFLRRCRGGVYGLGKGTAQDPCHKEGKNKPGLFLPFQKSPLSLKKRWAEFF